MYQNLGVGGGIVVNLLDFDFLVVDLEDGLYDRGCGLGEWYLGYGECLGVSFLDFGTDSDDAAPKSVVVFGDVDASARREVGV